MAQQQVVVAEEWTMDADHMEDMDHVSEQSLAVLHRFSGLENASSLVLEVGAGRGRASIEVLSRLPPGVELWLTDYSSSMVDHMTGVVLDAARMKMHMNPNNITVKVLKANVVDLSDILPQPGLVDSYLANLCLHHCSDMNKALREAFRVLKPGGRLAIAELDAERKGSMLEIAEKAKELAGFNHGPGHNHDHNHDHHNHDHHHHDHKNKDDSHGEKHHHTNQHQQQQQHQHPRDPHQHGNAENLRHQLQSIGFVNVVSWKMTCIGEIQDAARYAAATRRRIVQGDPQYLAAAAAAAASKEQQQQQLDTLEEKLRHLASIELDSGRPLDMGCVILIARKPMD